MDVVPPVITMLGPKRITLRTCKCLTLSGSTFPCAEERDYAAELEDVVRKMQWLLCEGHQGSACFYVTDQKGRENVKLDPSVVTIGPAELVPGAGPHKHFRVPHNAIDEAGNRARPLYREASRYMRGVT